MYTQSHSIIDIFVGGGGDHSTFQGLKRGYQFFFDVRNLKFAVLLLVKNDMCLREERLCKVCMQKEIEYEMHLLFHCTKCEYIRKKLIAKQAQMLKFTSSW